MATHDEQPSPNGSLPAPTPKETHPAEFARLLPGDQMAKMAFDSLAKRAQLGDLDSHNAKFLHVTGVSRALIPKLNTDTRTNQVLAYQQSLRHIFKGYWAFGWHLQGLEEVASFSFGRQDLANPQHKVDVPLALPSDAAFMSIKPLHFKLYMNRVSGRWFIRAHASMRIDGDRVRQGQIIYLLRTSTTIDINGMIMVLRSTITNGDQEKEYLKARNDALRRAKISIPNTKMSGLPFESDTILDPVVFGRNGLGSGTFGMVFEGFCMTSGGLRVVKRLQVKSSRTKKEASDEIQALQELQGAQGITKVYCVKNIQGGDDFLGEYPSDIFIVQEKGVPFLQLPTLTLQEKEWLMFCLLKGLEAVHDKGWIHRDINATNLLYFPGTNPHATLNDFGKVSFKSISDDWCIANEFYLPPEVVPRENQQYDQSIDIWMLGLALAQIFYNFPTVNARNYEEWEAMTEALYMDTESFMAILIVNMLKWKANDRPDVKALLADSAFHRFRSARGTKRAAPDGTKDAQKGPKVPKLSESKADISAEESLKDRKEKTAESDSTREVAPQHQAVDQIHPLSEYLSTVDLFGPGKPDWVAMVPQPEAQHQPATARPEAPSQLKAPPQQKAQAPEEARAPEEAHARQEVHAQQATPATEEKKESKGSGSTDDGPAAEDVGGATAINDVLAMPQGCSILKDERLRPRRPSED